MHNQAYHIPGRTTSALTSSSFVTSDLTNILSPPTLSDQLYSFLSFLFTTGCYGNFCSFFHKSNCRGSSNTRTAACYSRPVHSRVQGNSRLLTNVRIIIYRKIVEVITWRVTKNIMLLG